MIMILDNSPSKCSLIKNYIPSLIITHTVDDCIAKLKGLQDEVCVLLLAHDLADDVFVDSDRKNCGMEVVRWLIKNPKSTVRIILHDSNLDAVHTMENKLQKAYYHVTRFSYTELIELLSKVGDIFI